MGKQESDHDKLLKLYDLYEQKMYVVAYSILNSKWQAEDAVSESFIKIIKNLNKIKDAESDSTKSFIIKTIQHTAIDMYRKNQKERGIFTVISGEEEVQYVDKRNSVEELLDDIIEKEKLEALLSELPGKYRDIIICRCFHQMSVKETAAVLEIGESLVRKRYERAKKLLAKKLGGEEYEYKIIG